MTRLVMGVVAALVIVGGTGLAAGAQEGPSPGTNVLDSTISVPSTLDPSCSNADITVTTANLLPGSLATFTLFSDPVVLGEVTVGDDGTASITFDLPAGTTLGTHRVETDGINNQGDPETISVNLEVLSCATAPGTGGTGGTGNTGGGSGGGTDLARTGTDLQLPVRLGVVALAAGAALILATRKRQAQASV